MLVRLLYISRLNNLSDAAVTELTESILSTSRQHNTAKGITGVLIYNNTIVMQLLEGGREQVNALYNTISQDKRHSDVVILDFEEIAHRKFSDWSMGQVNLTKVNPSLLLKYSDTIQINPYMMSGKTSLALLEELMASAAIISR
ncbi:MAG: hypothetical protein RL344_650 [Pseudomonadota bacterium]|jgi:hypothetical protein